MIQLTKEQNKAITAHKRMKAQDAKEKANQLYLMGTMGECPKCSGKEIEKDIRRLKCKCGYELRV